MRDEWLTAMWAHQELKKLTFRRYYPAMHLQRIATKAQRKAKRIAARQDDAKLLLLISETFKEMNKAINNDVKRLEDKMTKASIRKEIAENRLEGNYFYLCSYRNDCAEDHLQYQGKVYVDEAAPRHHGFDTLQRALGAPAYLITRPNCRHFMIVITEEEATTKAADELLNEKHLRSNVERHTSSNNELTTLLKRMYKRRPSVALKKALKSK